MFRQVNAAAEEIYQAVDEDANIIFGALIDESFGSEMAVTVIATGFPDNNKNNDEETKRLASPVEV